MITRSCVMPNDPRLRTKLLNYLSEPLPHSEGICFCNPMLYVAFSWDCFNPTSNWDATVSLRALSSVYMNGMGCDSQKSRYILLRR